jgi:DNA-binding NarL/FixJ family response regulator
METPDVIRLFVAHLDTPEWTSVLTALRAEPGLRVVLELRGAELPPPSRLADAVDVLLVDSRAVDAAGEATVARLIAQVAPARTLIVSPDMGADRAVAAARLGAVGLLAVSSSHGVFVKSIRCVYAGEVWFDRRSTARVFSAIIPDLADDAGPLAAPDADPGSGSTLSKREREVVALLAEGLRNKQIAERLFISEITVRHHLTSIFSKLGVGDRKSLVLYSYRTGLARRPLPAGASRFH